MFFDLVKREEKVTPSGSQQKFWGKKKPFWTQKRKKQQKKIQKELKDDITKSIRNPFKLEKENKPKNKK